MDLWQPETEVDFFRSSLAITTKEQLFYKTNNDKYCAYWPKRYGGEKSTLQSRNSLIGNFTEKWTVDLLKDFARSKGLYAIQGATCDELGLPSRSSADVALCTRNSINQHPSTIKAIFEVKMSVVWNWEYKDNELILLGDYTTHQGNPGLLRSDSMLKAIGKSINIRVSTDAASSIPIVILGNTPITESYHEKVDQLKIKGIVQGFWSLNPKPNGSSATLKNTTHNGFIRMDNYAELVTYLDELLSQDLWYFSAMKSKTEIGKIIDMANKEDDFERKAEVFLKMIRC